MNIIPYDIQLNTTEFKTVVDSILKENIIDEIIETGTYHGDGSTKIWADTGKYVFTIECNYQNWLISSDYLANKQNVCVIHGLSLDRIDLIKFLLNENFDIDTTYDSKYPKTFYMREISQKVTVENALDIFVNNDRNQLVFLDSAGGVGYFEFKKFMTYDKNNLRNKVLMLDDISHIKHIRSVQFLKDSGFNVNISKDKRFAWCSFQEEHNREILNSF